MVDDLRKTFGNRDVPFWAPRLNNREISNDFSRRNTGFESTSALGSNLSPATPGPPGLFPITLMTRSVVDSSGQRHARGRRRRVVLNQIQTVLRAQRGNPLQLTSNPFRVPSVIILPSWHQGRLLGLQHVGRLGGQLGLVGLGGDLFCFLARLE